MIIDLETFTIIGLPIETLSKPYYLLHLVEIDSSWSIWNFLVYNHELKVMEKGVLVYVKTGDVFSYTERKFRVNEKV